MARDKALQYMVKSIWVQNLGILRWLKSQKRANFNDNRKWGKSNSSEYGDKTKPLKQQVKMREK
jgi:hypothetical protein